MATPLKQKLSKFHHVYLDTMCFIYQFSGQSEYVELTSEIFSSIEGNRLEATTSIITMLEILVRPEAENNQQLVKQYETTLDQFPHLAIRPVDWPIARIASRLRGENLSLRTPDAIHLATAMYNRCDLFITNDSKLKQVKGIKVLFLGDCL